MDGPYEPTWESLAGHEVPDWFHDAKLGIFIHWGPYAVPAYADPDGDHAYAEWYPYYMYQDGSDTQVYHEETYGSDVEYVDFVDDWHAEQWDPDAWASFFADDVGAKYVVLTAEHHDGFPLWPTHYTKYNAGEMGPERDLVGDLADAVRAEGLRFAGSYHANLNYYQPGFDGPFGHPDYYVGPDGFRDEESLPGDEYVDFLNAKHRELIRRYEPDALWFDVPIADADQYRAREVIADFYNRAATEWDKEVVVNDRSATDARDQDLWDFRTPEYDAYDEITPFKWEACRGIGRSFGYNAEETAEDHLRAEELVHTFVDMVSKNGNLLINVGPRADGTIPDLQREPLAGLGSWLSDHGDAIYATRPWVVAEDDAAEVAVRYTHKDDTLYAILLDRPADRLTLTGDGHLDASEVADVRVLADNESLSFEASDDLVVNAGDLPADHHAYALALEGVSPA